MLLRAFSFLAAVTLVVQPARAQDRDVPYWATIDTSKLNMRVGPSINYKIAWVYNRRGLPVKVKRTMQGWRLIEDPDGAQGWVVARLLSSDRGAMVVGLEVVPMRAGPADTAELKWRVEPGVVGKLGECSAGWCEFSVAERAGWVQQKSLWGAGAP